MQIIGIVLIKNEDIFLEKVLGNILDFCDEIIVADNNSSDKTWDTITRMAEHNRKIKPYQIEHPRESHEFIEHYAGTDTWIFAVDGDEIYDRFGLQRMKTLLQNGAYSNTWNIYGNVLNCTCIDFSKQRAKGYLSPPSRSMTKLYNFSLIESWTGCPERLHSGTLIFRKGIDVPPKRDIYLEHDWEDSFFRCLHAVFVSRSTLDHNMPGQSRLNPAEIESLRSALGRKSYLTFASRFVRYHFGQNWKKQKYCKGKLIEKSIEQFA